MWIQKIGEPIKYPERMNFDRAKERDKSKLCRFHNDHGHTTDECQNLKDEIERLIKEGPLRKFTQ